MLNGFYNVLKPTGMTSSDVVVKLRGILRRHFGEAAKVGHFGTLDPAGAGVLPVAVGRATRLFDYAGKEGKLYRAGFTFGVETDTLDSYGSVTKTCDILPSFDQINAVLPRFIGKIVQVPPKYSSISLQGKRAYDLAREGKDFTISGREVDIYGIDVIDIKGDMAVFDISCSVGTYIRSLARDISATLDTVGYMSFIIRLKSGYFSLSDSVTLDEIEKNPEKYLLPISFFTDNLERFDVPEAYADKVLNGVKVKFTSLPEKDFAVYVNGALLGVGENADGYLKVATRLI